MKHVFTDLSQVAHLWANQLQDGARNTGNFYFEKDTIYSYGSHFPIASHVVHNGVRGCLLTTRGYSVTTNKHIRIVQQAARHLNIIRCAYPCGTHGANFAAFLSEIESIATSLPKAKKPEIYLSKISRVASQVTVYATFFGLSIPIGLQAAMNIMNKSEYSEYAEKKEQFELAEQKRKQRELKAAHKKQLKKWFNFETSRLYTHDGHDYLRVNGERIETSQGVEIPIEVARKFYGRMQTILATGGCVDCNIKLMDYQVKSISMNEIVIGCHNVPMTEITRVAAQLKF